MSALDKGRHAMDGWASRVTRPMRAALREIAGLNGLAVFLELDDFQRDKPNCWPSLTALAKAAGIGRRSVSAAVVELAECNVIDVVSGTAAAPNKYAIRPFRDWKVSASSKRMTRLTVIKERARRARANNALGQTTHAPSANGAWGVVQTAQTKKDALEEGRKKNDTPLTPSGVESDELLLAPPYSETPDLYKRGGKWWPTKVTTAWLKAVHTETFPPGMPAGHPLSGYHDFIAAIGFNKAPDGVPSVWRKLSAEKRALAMQGAAGFRRENEARPKQMRTTVANYLSQGLWAGHITGDAGAGSLLPKRLNEASLRESIPKAVYHYQSFTRREEQIVVAIAAYAAYRNAVEAAGLPAGVALGAKEEVLWAAEVGPLELAKLRGAERATLLSRVIGLYTTDARFAANYPQMSDALKAYGSWKASQARYGGVDTKAPF